MSTQLEILGTIPLPPGTKLTARQRHALEHISRRQPVTHDELGAAVHEYRRDHGDGKGHDRNSRCMWCGDTGREVGAALRKHRLVKWKNNAGWTLPGYKPERPGTSGYDPKTAPIPY